MKKIENRKTELTHIKNITEENPNGKVINLGYLDLLLEGLNVIPEKGITTSEMAERFNVLSKIENIKLGDTVELEDAEFLVAYNCKIKNWAMMHKDIVEFDKYIESIKNKK